MQKLKGKKRKKMLLLKCGKCDSKKSKFIEQQEASGLLSSLGVKTPSVKFLQQVAGDKFMLEMHLRQPGFTYSACRPFKKQRKDTTV